MKKIFKYFCINLLFLATLGNISFASEYQFEVLSTTDMHGRATSHNISTGKKEPNSMLKVASIVKKERKNFGDKIILIDNGDLLQGTLITQYAIAVKTQEENPMVTAIKHMKYDAWIMGNHEYNYSPEQRDAQLNYAKNSNIAILGANIVRTSDGLNFDKVKVKKGSPYYTPFIVKTINFDSNKKVRVAIIGLGNANNAEWDRASNYPNLQFSSIENPKGLLEYEINKWAKKIQSENLADIIIVSVHSGKTTDTGITMNKFLKESQAISGTEKSKGIDLLIYGHDHAQNTEKIKTADDKEIYIVNAGGTSVTKTVFTLKFDDKNNFKSYTATSSNINLSNVKDDKELKKINEHWYNDTLTWASQPFGYFGKGWNAYKSELIGKTNKDLVLNQTQVNNLIHKVQLWASWQNKGIAGATVSTTVSVLSTKSDGTVVYTPSDNDNVNMLNLSLLYRFSNNILCTVDMTPTQLYNWMSTVADKLIINEKGQAAINPSEQIHGVDTFYGIDYTFDLTKPKGQRVVSAKINGENLLSIKTPIRVVMNTYRVSGGYGFYKATGLKESDCVWQSTDFLPPESASIQALLGAYFKAKGTVEPNDTVEHVSYSTWKIITENK